MDATARVEVVEPRGVFGFRDYDKLRVRQPGSELSSHRRSAVEVVLAPEEQDRHRHLGEQVVREEQVEVLFPGSG